MTAKEYWECEPYLAKAYRESYELKVDMTNQELWLQGLYINNAFETVIYNSFGRKKGQKAEKYIQHPIDLHKKVDSQDENIKKTIDSLNALKKRWDNGRH